MLEGKGSIMQTHNDVIEVNTDPVFKGDMAACEECDWRPPDGGIQPELRCREHTAITGHMTSIPIIEYVYYESENAPQA